MNIVKNSLNLAALLKRVPEEQQDIGGKLKAFTLTGGGFSFETAQYR